jgi:hypothetical protein
MSLEEKKWEKLLDGVYEFCDKNDISKLELEDEYIDPHQRRKKLELHTNITIR